MREIEEKGHRGGYHGRGYTLATIAERALVCENERESEKDSEMTPGGIDKGMGEIIEGARDIGGGTLNIKP